MITRIRQKPDIGRRSPFKGQGQGRVQTERDQSENSGRRSTPQLNQNPTRSARTAWATQNKNKEFLRSRKGAAMSPPNLARRCQCAQVTEEATSRPRSRQRAHALGECTEEWATTKSGRLWGISGLQGASSATRGLSIAVAQTSERGIKGIVL